MIGSFKEVKEENDLETILVALGCASSGCFFGSFWIPCSAKNILTKLHPKNVFYSS